MGHEPYVRIFTPAVSHNRVRNVAIATRLVDKVKDQLKGTFGLPDIRVQVCDDNDDFPTNKKFQRFEFTVAVFVDFEICLGTFEVSEESVAEAAAFIMTLWCQQQDYESARQSFMENSITEIDSSESSESETQSAETTKSSNESEFNEDFFSQLSKAAAQLRPQGDADIEGC